jgi:hypothetical protein
MVTLVFRSLRLTALFAVMSLVVGVGTAGATPHPHADVSGNGSGVGWEYPESQPSPDCPVPPNPEPPAPAIFGEVTGDHFELFYPDSTFAAQASNVPTALYLGDAEIDINVAAHVISPFGTHTTCADAPTPTPVPIESAVVSGQAGGAGTGSPGKVDCTANSGSYTRAQSAVTFTFTADCQEVRGNSVPFTAQVSDHSVNFVITGTMVPCNDPFTGEPNQDCAAAPNGPDAGSVLNTAFVAS